MKVKCPQCASQYNLDPAKIAPAGVKVRCPSCTHVFVVRRKQDEPAQAASPMPAASAVPKPPPAAAPSSRPAPAAAGGEDDAIALDDTAPTDSFEAAESDHSDMEGLPPDFEEQPAPAPVAPPPAPSPPPAAPAPAAAAGSPNADGPAPTAAIARGTFTGEGQWRVKKSGLGLVYGPADMSTVESWIRAERVGGQDQYSLDGGPWGPPSHFQIIAAKFGIAYAGPPKPETFAEAPASPPAPPPAVPTPPSRKPAPAPKSAVPSAPASPSKPLEFDLPDDDFGPEASDGGGGGIFWKVAIGLLVVLLGAGAAFYFLILRVPENRRALLAKLPVGVAREGAETLANTIAPVEPAAPVGTGGPSRSTRVDAIRRLGDRIPQAEKARFRAAVTSFFADTTEGYNQTVATLQGLAADVPAEALPLRAFLTVTQAMGVYRGKINGDPQDLLTKADTLKDAAPSDSMALDAFALALLINGMTEEAAAVTDQVLTSVDDPVARYIRSRAHPPGIEDLEGARELQARFVAATLALSEARLAQGQAETAKQLVEEVLSWVPGHKAAQEMLVERVEPALTGKPIPAASQEAKEKLPDDPLALFDSGRARFDAGEMDKAEKLFFRVLDEYYEQVGLQRVALTHYYLGEIYRLRNQIDLARAQYEAALQVAPNFSKAQEKLDILATAR